MSEAEYRRVSSPQAFERSAWGGEERERKREKEKLLELWDRDRPLTIICRRRSMTGREGERRRNTTASTPRGRRDALNIAVAG